MCRFKAFQSNPTAAAAYGANFHADDPRHARDRDITSTTPGQLVRALKLGRVAEAFDVVIGGPPCQAFARVGRSKLREIEAHPEAFRHDPRATLCTPYLSYVNSCRPLALLMENVPDVMNFGGHNVPEEVCEVLEDLGYVCGYTLLNAAFYGVPQTRERMFLIAYRREIASSVTFPRPTHWVDLPPGYEGSRRVALKALSNGDTFAEAHNYTDPPEAANTLPPAVTAEEAIGDLPEIDARALMRRGVLKRGARRFDTLTPYDESRSVSEYAWSMKSWVGFKAGDGVYDHVIRYLPRDYPLFARMKEGDQYPEAHRLALTMFAEKLSELAKKSVAIMPGSPEHEELKASIVPPYDAGKYPNKWRKISRDQPVRTVMAHLSKDGYSHIHYDNSQARTISVREAARLQSFPDGFLFAGAMNEACLSALRIHLLGVDCVRKMASGSILHVVCVCINRIGTERSIPADRERRPAPDGKSDCRGNHEDHPGVGRRAAATGLALDRSPNGGQRRNAGRRVRSVCGGEDR